MSIDYRGLKQYPQDKRNATIRNPYAVGRDVNRPREVFHCMQASLIWIRLSIAIFLGLVTAGSARSDIHSLWNEASPPEAVSTDNLKEMVPFVFPAIYLPALDGRLRRREFHYSGKTERGSFRYEQTFLSDRYGIFVDLFGEGDSIGVAQMLESRPRIILEDIMAGSELAAQMVGLADAVVKLIVNVPDDMPQDRFARAMHALTPPHLDTEFTSQVVGVGGKTTPWTVIQSARLDAEDPNRVFVYTTLLAVPIRAAEDKDWCQAVSGAALLGAPPSAITDRFGGSLSSASLGKFSYGQFFETDLGIRLQRTDKLFFHQLTATFWIIRENKVLGLMVPRVGMRKGGVEWAINLFLSRTARTGTTWIAHEDSRLSRASREMQKVDPSFRVFHLVLSSECPTQVDFVGFTIRPDSLKDKQLIVMTPVPTHFLISDLLIARPLSHEQPATRVSTESATTTPTELKGFDYTATVYDAPSLELAQSSLVQFCIDKKAYDGTLIPCVQLQDSPPVFKCGLPDICLDAFVKSKEKQRSQAEALPQRERTEVAASATSEEIPRISAIDLNQVWADNEIAAKQKYYRKRLEVFGTVDRVREGTGPRDASIDLAGTMLTGVVCSLVEGQWELAAQLRKGQAITVRGTCYGNLGSLTGGVILTNCEIVQ